MKRAISNIAWPAEARLEAYAAMADGAVTGLEIAPGLFFHAAADPFAPEAPVARAALDEIAAAGLSLVSMQSLLFGVEGAALFGDAEAQARFENGLGRAIDLAGRFGIPNLVFGSPAQRSVPGDLPMDAALGAAAEVFHRLGERARAAGTVLAVEANPVAYGTNFLNTLDEAAAFVSRVGHPHITLILDLGAMRMNGEYDQTPERVPALLPRLSHVHVSEPDLAPAPAEAAALAPVLRALDRGGYTGAVSIEMKRTPDGIAGIRAALGRLRAAGRMEQA